MYMRVIKRRKRVNSSVRRLTGSSFVCHPAKGQDQSLPAWLAENRHRKAGCCWVLYRGGRLSFGVGSSGRQRCLARSVLRRRVACVLFVSAGSPNSVVAKEDMYRISNKSEDYEQYLIAFNWPLLTPCLQALALDIDDRAPETLRVVWWYSSCPSFSGLWLRGYTTSPQPNRMNS